MRNDFGTRYSPPRFPYKKGGSAKKKKQGYKARRKESEGMEKAMGRRKYAAVKTMDKIKMFFDHFQALPSWFTNLWILVCASIFGIKGTQIFRNGKK